MCNINKIPRSTNNASPGLQRMSTRGLVACRAPGDRHTYLCIATVVNDRALPCIARRVASRAPIPRIKPAAPPRSNPILIGKSSRYFQQAFATGRLDERGGTSGSDRDRKM
jgi:hypothetical protein